MALNNQRVPWLIVTLGVAIMYLGGSTLVMLPFSPNLINLFWPPAGFAFAALWWFGRRAVAGVILGSLLTSLLVFSNTKPALIAPMALAPLLEALLAVWWLKKQQGISDIFESPDTIFKFILSAVLIAPIPAAVIGTATLHINGLLTHELWQTWQAWWVGDSMGMLLVAPFLLCVPMWRKSLPQASRLPELLVVGLLLAWLWLDLFTAAPAQNLPPLSFLALPLFIWIAVRFRIGVLTAILFAASLFAIHGTAAGLGPCVRDTLQESIRYLYGFLWALACVGLFINISIAYSQRSLFRLARERRALQASEASLRVTLEHTPNVAVQWYDRGGHVTYWNNASERLYGWSNTEATGKTLDQLIHTKEEAANFTQALDEITNTGDCIGPAVTPVRHRDGSLRHVLYTLFAMPEAEGKAQRFVCMDVDITQLLTTEEELRQANQHLQEAQRIGKIGSWEWDIPANKITGSDEAFRIFGFDPATTPDFSTVHELIHPDDKDDHLNAVAQACTYPNHTYDMEYRIICPDGAIRVIHKQADVVYDNKHRPIRATGTVRDVTELNQAKAEIERLAYYDELTALPNRRLLHNLLGQHIADSATHPHYFGLLFVDIDDFKTLNDTHGHQAGDTMLKLAAERIQHCLGKEAILARPGGDEFGILLANLPEDAESARHAAMGVAETIRNALTQPFAFGDHVYHSSASIGAAIFNGMHTPAEALQLALHDMLKQADTALFHAKNAGRNAICFFEPHMLDTITSRLAIEQDLRKALNNEEFRLYLQPQVNPAGNIVGAECLLRWQHPVHGMLPPTQFISAAESTGLIVGIGNWVLRQACALIARLEASGHYVRISVNVSPRQFRQHDFVLQVKEALATTNAEPQRLILEITESVLVENISDVIARMTELEHLGVAFSIDDFGTGYSSLSYLKHLPIRELKIDKSFVNGLPRDQDDNAIVGSILALAQNLGLEVVAEGIETPEQYEHLKAGGCQLFQGYLCGRPVASEELLASLLA